MADTNVVKRTYPWQTSVGGVEMTLRLMEPSDRDTILNFGRSLPDHDLLFLRTDVTNPTVIDEWVETRKKGRTITVRAEAGSELLGHHSLHHTDFLVTLHVVEIRVLLKP